MAETDNSELKEILKDWSNQPHRFIPQYSKKYCLDIASTLPNKTLKELILRAEEIKNWLEADNV